MSNQATFSQRFNLLYEELHLSQTAFANKYEDLFGDHLSRNQVSDWLLEKSIPTTDRIINLSKMFNVSTDYLLGLENTPQTKNDSFISKELGLSQKSIENLKTAKQFEFHGLDTLLSSNIASVIELDGLLSDLLRKREYFSYMISDSDFVTQFSLKDFKNMKLMKINSLLSNLDNLLNDTDTLENESWDNPNFKPIVLDTDGKLQEKLQEQINTMNFMKLVNYKKIESLKNKINKKEKESTKIKEKLKELPKIKTQNKQQSKPKGLEKLFKEDK